MYDRKIIYLHRYEGEMDKGNAGYIKQENRNGTISFTVMLMNMPPAYQAETTLQILPFGHTLCKVHIRDGKGQGMAICEEKTLEKGGIFYGKIEKFGIQVSDVTSIRGEVAKPKIKREEVKPAENSEVLDYEPKMGWSDKVTDVSETEKEKNVTLVSEDVQDNEPIEADDRCWHQQPPTYKSKWDHISSGRKKVSLGGRESEYVKITPGDMIALSNPYHSLVNNAFLLHGYYNYKHLILGPAKGNKCSFFIGVPGNFYKQEVNAARMFGFEYFENGEDKVEVGDFGYYMKKVKL